MELGKDTLLAAYRTMKTIRQFEERLLDPAPRRHTPPLETSRTVNRTIVSRLAPAGPPMATLRAVLK